MVYIHFTSNAPSRCFISLWPWTFLVYQGNKQTVMTAAQKIPSVWIFKKAETSFAICTTIITLYIHYSTFNHNFHDHL